MRLVTIGLLLLCMAVGARAEDAGEVWQGDLTGSFEVMSRAADPTGTVKDIPVFALYLDGTAAEALWRSMPQEAKPDACYAAPFKQAGGITCFAPYAKSDGSLSPYLCFIGLNLKDGSTETFGGC